MGRRAADLEAGRLGGVRTATSTRTRREKTSSDETVQWHGSVVVRQSAVAPASVVCRHHGQDTRPTDCLAAKACACGAPGQAAATKLTVVAAWTCPRVRAQGRDKVNNGVRCSAEWYGVARYDAMRFGSDATVR